MNKFLCTALLLPTLASAGVDSKVFPLSVDEIKYLREKAASIKRAKEEVQALAPVNTASTIRVRSLIEDEAPPVLNAVAGFVSTVFFKGQNDAIWPIERIVSRSSAIDINFDEKGPRQSFDVSAIKPYKQTNISVYLKGRVQPITLFVNTKADINAGFDAQLTIQIQGMLESGIPKTFSNFNQVSESLNQALNFRPKGKEWQQLSFDGFDNSAAKLWAKGERAILKLKGAELFAPDYLSEASNADGTTHVYEFDYLPASYSISFAGELKTLNLSATELSRAIAGDGHE